VDTEVNGGADEAALLLVEDNPDDAELTLRALTRQRLSNEIVIARDGAEAVALFEPGGRFEHDLPHLVVLDLNLPRIDGIGVLRHLKGSQRTAEVPVVVLTSSEEEADMVESFGVGANGFVRKPFDFQGLMNAVRMSGLSVAIHRAADR
jgi:two-component system, response regulator